MEIKNTTAYTYDALTAFSKSHAASPEGKKGNVLLWVAGILTAGSLIRYGVHLLMGNRTPLYCLVFVSSVVVAICFILVLLTPRIHAKRRARQNTVVSYGFAEDGLTHSAQNGEITSLPYDGIRKVTESLDYYFLYVAEGDALIVSRSGFTEGSENDFRLLLRTVIDPQKLHIQ